MVFEILLPASGDAIFHPRRPPLLETCIYYSCRNEAFFIAHGPGDYLDRAWGAIENFRIICDMVC